MSNRITDNPLLQPFTSKYQAPPFDQIREHHYIPAIECLIAEAEEKIAAVVNNPEAPTFENTILPLEQNGEQLGIVANILFNLNQAETTKKMQQVAQDASKLFTDFASRMLMNAALFNRIDAVNNYLNEHAPLSAEQTMVIHKWHRDFVSNGAMLDEKSKIRLAEIRSKLSLLSLQFSDHVLAETNAFVLHLTREDDLQGLPGFVKEAAAQEAESRNLDGWVFTLHAPSYLPFIKYSDRRDLREKMMRAYGLRGNQDNEHDNKAIIREIVNLRVEQAQLMHEPDFASYQLKESMAGSTEKVLSFLKELHRYSQPAARRELNEVTAFAQSTGIDFELESWDWSYYAEKLRQKKYNFNDELLKPYFKLENTIKAVFQLANRLYGLHFNPVSDLPVYHPDVKVYEVNDESGAFLALLYLDFFPRPGKQGGAWMTDFRGQSNLNGKPVRPHISLVCNFSKPTNDKPSLLTHDEVNTFLHEFGHALHGMLSQCIYPTVSGTNVYRDFVELPSQIMENWSMEKEWLDWFAVHYETGEKIPIDLINRLVESQNYLEGYACERQLSFGFLDMAWHTLTQPFSDDPVEFEKQAMSDTQIFRKMPGTAISTSFGHIFAGGYSAGYYGYKWSEVLDADAFEVFSKNGIFNKDVADSFRKNILEKGGSEHPMDLYVRFRKQEPDVKALLKRSGLIADK